MCKPPMSGTAKGARALVRPPTPEEKFRRGSDRSREVNSRSIRESRNAVGPATTIEERVVALRRGRGSLGKAVRVPPAEAAGPTRKDVRSVAQRSDARGRRRRGTAAGPTDGDDRPGPYLVDAGEMRATPRDRRRRRRRGRRRRSRVRGGGRALRLSSARLVDPAATSFAIPPASAEPTASLAPRTRPGRNRRGRAHIRPDHSCWPRGSAGNPRDRRGESSRSFRPGVRRRARGRLDDGRRRTTTTDTSARARTGRRRLTPRIARPWKTRRGRDQGRHQRCADPPHAHNLIVIPTPCSDTVPAYDWGHDGGKGNVGGGGGAGRDRVHASPSRSERKSEGKPEPRSDDRRYDGSGRSSRIHSRRDVADARRRAGAAGHHRNERRRGRASGF